MTCPPATISFVAASASNIIYTMDLSGFRDWLYALTRVPRSPEIDDELLRHIRVAVRIIAQDFHATPRQWAMMQSAFTHRANMAFHG